MTIERNLKRPGLRYAGLLFVAAGLAACGGGGGSIDDGGGNGPTGAIDGGGLRVVSGPINGFGSVIVNGVRYDTSAAEIIVDGQPATEADLEVGQVVVVSATDDDGSLSAQRVVYDENVEGPIDSIDLAGSTLVVLGQTVVVNGGTSFDDDVPGRTIEGLATGDFIEVSGYVDSAGRIVATRIELEDGSGDLEVTGFVSGLDAAAFTFEINDLVVDYSQATLEDFDGGEISDGDLVEAEGDQLGGNGELIARRVERKDDVFDDDLDDDAEVEIEGLVTRFVSATDFDVSGVPVTTTSGTEFEDGTAADLALDVLVEVDGAFDANGVLVADEVDFEDDGQIEISARADSVDAAAGEVVLLGITVITGPETRFEDDSDADLRPFSLDDVSAGDWLEIRGFETEAGSGTVTATRLERDDADDEASIRGFATDVADPSFRILGLDIDTDGNTEFDDVDRGTFFASAEGRLVEVDGNLNGSRFLASEVEFEDED